MRRITGAVLAWTILWLAALWALDPASTIGRKPPAWVLFEFWAVGFVVLGAIWNRTPSGSGTSSDRVRMEDRALSRLTWAILAWTVLWMVLFGIWAVDPDASSIGQGPGSGDPIGVKPPEWVLFDAWLLGFILLGAIWFVRRWRNAQHRGT
jgi:hypothetical protein